MLKQYLLPYFKRNRITSFDLTIFFRQFATLLSTGIPIIHSCDTLEKSQTKNQMRLLIKNIKKEIASGKSLSQTFTNYPLYFNPLICQLIKIGEHTGRLDRMLNIVAEYQEKKLFFHKRVKRALFYPLFIAIVACVMVLILLLFVIPQFAELFQTTSIQLPLITLWIFNISAVLKKYFLLSLFIFVTFLVIVFFNLKKINFKRIFFKLPILKPITHKFILSQFARCVAMTFGAGLSITESLSLAAHTSGHLEFVTAVTKIRSKISAGVMLHKAMMTYAYFPILMIQMVKIGEESGKLSEMFDKIADFLESDLDQILNSLSELLEPLIMLGLGVLIGGLVIGMYLPIFKLGNTF